MSAHSVPSKRKQGLKHYTLSDNAWPIGRDGPSLGRLGRKFHVVAGTGIRVIRIGLKPWILLPAHNLRFLVAIVGGGHSLAMKRVGCRATPSRMAAAPGRSCQVPQARDRPTRVSRTHVHGPHTARSSTGKGTGHFSSLARTGRRLTHVCVKPGVRTPSRARLLTGCSAQRVGMDGNPRDGQALRPVWPYERNPDERTLRWTVGRKVDRLGCTWRISRGWADLRGERGDVLGDLGEVPAAF